MKTICVVDDTPDLLQNFSDFLTMEGFEVWPCIGGVEALERMRTSAPDLIITDLWMPSMDGLAFIGHVRSEQRLRDTPVVIFSSRPVQDYQDKAKELGVVRCMKKPAPLEEILTVIRTVFEP
jgi:chemosensory pili system protein ChpA (sensor histidine kinase/response regulator)